MGKSIDSIAEITCYKCSKWHKAARQVGWLKWGTMHQKKNGSGAMVDETKAAVQSGVNNNQDQFKQI